MKYIMHMDCVGYISRLQYRSVNTAFPDFQISVQVERKHVKAEGLGKKNLLEHFARLMLSHSGS